MDDVGFTQLLAPRNSSTELSDLTGGPQEPAAKSLR
jgi:hypothetical protein